MVNINPAENKQVRLTKEIPVHWTSARTAWLDIKGLMKIWLCLVATYLAKAYSVNKFDLLWQSSLLRAIEVHLICLRKSIKIEIKLMAKKCVLFLAWIWVFYEGIVSDVFWHIVSQAIFSP